MSLRTRRAKGQRKPKKTALGYSESPSAAFVRYPHSFSVGIPANGSDSKTGRRGPARSDSLNLLTLTYLKTWCRERDLNPHEISPTGSLVLRVCQFRHPGLSTRLFLREAPMSRTIAPKQRRKEIAAFNPHAPHLQLARSASRYSSPSSPIASTGQPSIASMHI